MRPHNSVGGFRIYPSSPQAAESHERAIASIGQFREGMDRLNRERQLTQTQQQRLDQLDPNSQRVDNYRRLIVTSDRLWQMALAKQQALNRLDDSGQFSAGQLGHCRAQTMADVSPTMLHSTICSAWLSSLSALARSVSWQGRDGRAAPRAQRHGSVAFFHHAMRLQPSVSGALVLTRQMTYSESWSSAALGRLGQRVPQLSKGAVSTLSNR